MELSELIAYFIFYGIPIGLVIWFIVSLILYIRRDKSNAKQCRGRLIRLIISAVTAAVMVLAVVSITVMLMFAIAHM